jgi:hypothetical protein
MNRNSNARGIRVADEVPTGALSRIEGRQEAMEIGPEVANFFEYEASKELLLRLRYDADMVTSITELARSQGIAAASFTAIGALKSARLAHYDQRSHEYREIRIDSAFALLQPGQASLDCSPRAAFSKRKDNPGSTKTLWKQERLNLMMTWLQCWQKCLDAQKGWSKTKVGYSVSM